MIRFFPLVINALVIIMYSRQLDTTQYGTYLNFWIKVYILSPLALIGLPTFIITYSPDFIINFFRRLAVKYYVAFFAWLIIICTIYTILQCQVINIHWYVPFFFLFFYLSSLICEPVLVGAELYSVLVVTNTVYAIAFGWAHYQFLIHQIDLEGLFAYLLLFVLTRTTIYAVTIYLTSKKIKWADNHDIVGVHSLWFHMGFYGISQLVFKWVDKFLVSILLTGGLSAVYYNGSIEIPFLSLILGSVASALLIQLANSKDKPDNKYTLNLMLYSSRLLSAVIFPLFFFLVFFRHELFLVLLSEKYLLSIDIFLVSVMLVPLNAYHLTAVLQNRQKGFIINVGAVLDFVIALALMYPLYRLMGLPGIALSCVVSSYSQAIYYLYHTSKLLQVDMIKLIPLSNWVVKLVSFGILFLIFHYTVTTNFSQQNALILGIIFAVSVALLSLSIELKLSNHKYGDLSQFKV